MRTTGTPSNAADSQVVSNRERGEAIKRRRLTLGIGTPSEFAELTGRDRQTVKRAEEGEAADATYDMLEVWLDRQEQENDVPAQPAEGSPIEIIFQDVTTSSIGRIIVHMPSDPPEGLGAAVAHLIAEVRKGENT